MGFTKTIDWISMWISDKKNIIAIMYTNMADDLSNGYDPCGLSIRKQQAEISEYIAKFDAELMALADKSDEAAQRWAYYDMLRRGVIE